MIQSLIVAVIVAAAALWLGRRWLPAGLRARLHLTSAEACGKSGCGSKTCNGCH